jgi:5-methyltetrahydropteroyltriglutamate--homocysteine methyltransferase
VETWFDASSQSLPTEAVGSIPRPASLQRAVLDSEAQLTGEAAFETEYDGATRDTVARLIETGSRVITDGEQRRQSFATYMLDDQGAGSDDVFAVFADGHHRVVPRITQHPFRFAHSAAESVRTVKSLLSSAHVFEATGSVSKPAVQLGIKQAVVSPSMLSLMYPPDGIAQYSYEEFLDDVVSECVADISSCFAEGAVRVSIDFTEGRLALRSDLRAPWAGSDALPGFIDLVNRVLSSLPEQQRRAVGVHTCPGNDRDSEHSADIDYADLIPELLQIEAGYFLVHAAGEEDPDRVAQLLGAQISKKPAQTAPRILLGVTRPTHPRLETPHEIQRQLVRAARFIPAELLGSTDDCGFSPYQIDEKPRHGSPDFARRVAFAKIAARVQGTKQATAELNGHPGA